MISAVLLAAGASRRFGAQKLLQLLDGKAIVRWSAENLIGEPVDAAQFEERWVTPMLAVSDQAQ